jgi:hypothetical protein
VAEILPKDRRGQILLLLTVAAVTTLYVLWQGFAPVGIDGVTQYNLRRDSLLARIVVLESRVTHLKAEVRHGTTQQLTERLALARSEAIAGEESAYRGRLEGGSVTGGSVELFR